MSKMRNAFYSFFYNISAEKDLHENKADRVNNSITFFKFFILFFIWSGNFKLFFFSEGKVSPVFDRMCCAMEFRKHFWITLKIILGKLILTANLMFAFCNESKSSSSTNLFFMIIQKPKSCFCKINSLFTFIYSLVSRSKHFLTSSTER